MKEKEKETDPNNLASRTVVAIKIDLLKIKKACGLVEVTKKEKKAKEMVTKEIA